MHPNDLEELKKPFGLLIPDSKVTKPRIASITKGAQKIISVGDATTERLFNFGIMPDLALIDGKERRHSRKQLEFAGDTLHCVNPAGSLSRAAVELLKKALKEKKPVLIIVEGEEDMLALPLFALSPLGSVVLYGQPLEGMVAVRITPRKRAKAINLMDRIGIKDQ